LELHDTFEFGCAFQDVQEHKQSRENQGGNRTLACPDIMRIQKYTSTRLILAGIPGCLA